MNINYYLLNVFALSPTKLLKALISCKLWDSSHYMDKKEEDRGNRTSQALAHKCRARL